jgi:hypothetical protein
MNLALKVWFTHASTSTQVGEIESSFDSIIKPDIPVVTRQVVSHLKKKETINAVKLPFRALRYRLSKSIVLFKDPIAIFSAGWLYRKYRMKVICMIRNPMGFVGSLKKARWNYDFSDLLKQDIFVKSRLNKYYPSIKYFAQNPGDIIDHGCLLWNLFHSAILKYMEEYPTWYFIKHEQVSRDPVAEFNKIFAYLDLEMNESIAKRIKHYTSSKNSSDTDTTAFGPRNARGSLSTWKKRLTSEEITRIHEITAPVAKQFYRFPEMT